jgi:hypothetical protein
MKSMFLLLCVLCTTAALGQAGPGIYTLSNQPVVVQLPSHTEHAASRPMGARQNLLEGSSLVYAQGERPPVEALPKSTPVPLGDVARAYRMQKQQAVAAKASKVVEN